MESHKYSEFQKRNKQLLFLFYITFYCITVLTYNIKVQLSVAEVFTIGVHNICTFNLRHVCECD